MSKYTTGNELFIGAQVPDDNKNPQSSTDSAPFSDRAGEVPVNTCALTKHSNNNTRQLSTDLTALESDHLTMIAFKATWKSEFYSFSRMRYQATGPKGEFTRHPAFDEFPSFLSHVGPKNHPSDTLDRIDHTNPEYGPGLVRWASKSTQSHNRGNTKTLTDSQGNACSIAEWSRKTGISASTIRNRLASGKTVDEAVHTPVGGFPTPTNDSPTNIKESVNLWRKVLKESHQQEFFAPQGKDYKQLQAIVDALAEGKVWPHKALEHVLTNWRKFTDFAERDYGAWQKAPRVPTISYLHANVQAAGNFYLESTRDKSPTHKPGRTKYDL